MFKIARYKDFHIENKFEKIINKLINGNFTEVKKLSNMPYFRIKVDYENRIIFSFLNHENTKYILLLEYIPNHDYNKSQFIRGKNFSEEDFIFPKEEEIESTIFINQKEEFRYLDKFISFSESQENILNIQPPIILIGSAGSGKTSVLIEKLRSLNGKNLYTTLSKNLIEKSKEICECSENIDFLNFHELFNIKNEIDFENFKKFAQRHLIFDIELYFEEFRGVITGTFEKNFLSENEYLELGLKNTLFTARDRKQVYEIFKKYLQYLKDNNLVDSNMLDLNLDKNYNFIIIDEVQDFTNAQIFAILKHGENFILSGDSNQIIYSNFFSWSKLKTMLFKTEEHSKVTILQENYRNSVSISNISNRLLKIKQLRFGSIDRESNYLIETISKKVGKISLWIGAKTALELNEKKRHDVSFAVIVFSEKYKTEAKTHFDTPLIFTVQEAKGLEYKNVILFNFISNEAKQFDGIVNDVYMSDLEKELKYSRPKDKTDRELDIYKIYINSLFVAFTRCIENLYIFERRHHKIFDLLNIVKSEDQIFERTVSDNLEWEKESQRLKKFDRIEQVENIKNRINNRISVEEHLENLRKDVFDKGNNTKSNKDKLFKIAKVLHNIEIIRKMANDLDFKNAKIYLDSFGKEDLNLAIQNIDILKLQKAINSGYSIKDLNIYKLVERKTKVEFLKLLIINGANVNSLDTFGNHIMFLAINDNQIDLLKLLIINGTNVNFVNPEGWTAFTIASGQGNLEIVKLLVNNGANVNFVNHEGITALMLASGQGHLEIVKILVNNGANVNLVNHKGITALTIASQFGHLEIVKILIINGANVNLVIHEGWTALMVASQFGHLEIVKLLVNNGANVNLVNHEGATALMVASQFGHLEIVKILVNNGANVNLVIHEGWTALMIASQFGHLEIVKILTSVGG